ncbi:hypothetical protein EDB19DRAFT_1954857 [Suillus lakei]|nr:hypothetical protein EDB19DRAFT_1954857 [Suillus lakei]
MGWPTSLQVTEGSASTLSQLSSPTPSPPSSPIIKYKLFVPGMKRKASTPSPQPKPKLEEASRAPTNGCKSVKAKSKEFVGDNTNSNLQDKVIYVQKKTSEVGISAQRPARSPSVESAYSASGDPHPVRLFPVQCEQCIKDDTPCTMILAKKMGKIWKCCLNCDVKKTKCTYPSTEEQQALRAAIALKKAKASAAAAEKRVQNSTRAKTTPLGGNLDPGPQLP